MNHDPLRSVALIHQPLEGRVGVGVDPGFRRLPFTLAVAAIVRNEQCGSGGGNAGGVVPILPLNEMLRRAPATGGTTQ